MKLICSWYLLASALIATLAAPSAAATSGFAQTNQVVAPAPADARRLASFFSPPYQAGPMPSAVEEILLRDVPLEMRAECAATVARWAPGARGRARIALHILAVAAGSAWLAYRCDSQAGPFDGRYNERLAVFNSTRRTIQFLDLETSHDRADTIYHVGLSAIVKLRGAENSAAFEVFVASPSPGQGSPPRQTENRFVVIANAPSRAWTALSVVTARQRLATADAAAPGATPGVTAGGVYRAGVRFEHDIDGNLTAVVAYYRDARSRSGVTRYVWIPSALRFAVARPLPLPPVGQASTGRAPPAPPPVLLPPVPADRPLAH